MLVIHISNKAKVCAIVTSQVFLYVLLPQSVSAHGNGKTHVKEMYSVLPFAVQENGSATSENKPIADWLGMITSDLIDNYWGKQYDDYGGKSFYDYLRDEFDFHCKHRLLFHWGFNSRPWSEALEEKISGYDWYSDPETVTRFKQLFVTEQARRNRQANAVTEELFGLTSSGKEAAWANGIISVVYDVHLLGDWVPDDNSDFDGVTPPSKIVIDLVNAVRRIDPQKSKSIEKELIAVSKSATDENEMAVMLIAKLQTLFPDFLLESNDGALKRKFQAKGFTLKSR